MDGLFDIPARPAGDKLPAGVLFAEDFDLPARPDEPAVIAPEFTAQELAAAREAGFAAGRDLGLAEAAVETEAALAVASRSVAAQITALGAEAQAAAEAAARAVAQLLLDTLAALFPTVCARHGAAEAEAVLRALVPGLATEPALALRANPRLLPGLRAELARLDPALAARTDFTPSELAAPGDIALAWQHGSAERSAAAMWAAVAGALAPAGLDLSPILEPTDVR
jgi:flagellar assembly protein FliH